jgi:2-polyprenyl-6-methoxyphenol hydroxylase-like FAD-dependent oxidoreductase
MSTVKPITIVGGGLAGLTLGIGLRQRKVPVTVWEAGHYPRHRVCGEFISGRGQDVLERLGLMQELGFAGACLSRTARFFLGECISPVRPMRPPALCLSRFQLDQLLAERFRDAGGDLRENSRFETGHHTEGIVQACGRQVQPLQQGWRWFGLKMHVRGVKLTADLEMHGARHGYVGLCRLPNGEVNVCGLFRTRPGTRIAENGARELLKGVPGTWLHQRMASAVLQEGSFCSVAGLPLRPQRASGHNECRLGDALTMVPPVTGNGMSMAFEAAELSISPLAAYAAGETSWKEARQMIAQACDSAFRQRLAWARWLQWMMFSPLLRSRFGTLALSSGQLWRLIFTHTR